MRRPLRVALGSLQLPIAGIGAALVAFSLWNVYTLPPPPPESDGFVQGLAGFFFLIITLSGFVLAAVGLLVPPGPGYGINFTRGPRLLFVYALVAPVAGGIAFLAPIVVGFGAGGVIEWAFTLSFLVIASAPLAILLGLGWKTVTVAVTRYRA
ncbi:hypothetical protein C453_18405 [Haloferax elongans ATCC BAA-1513]|uniref:Uncharacterized protein n=1 Tax=Haloferax elongans ATCC BAA-1513 TaxID=1230453 RepID=M0H8R8_HALEO|nr:hypothetical protein [Haloferax elongans]ELZ80936.1 hypothetical protein C453_18405 [Haloferax elongans ATCC BAA-1513]